MMATSSHHQAVKDNLTFTIQAQIAQYCKTEIVFNGLMMVTSRQSM
jgi:hypothetical protein